MNELTIRQGSELLKRLDHAETAKAVIHETCEINFRHRNSGTMMSVYPYATNDSVHIQSVQMPKEVLDQMHSETLRYFSRMKRHIDNYIYELRQQLEDLTDRKEAINDREGDKSTESR